MMHGQKNVKFYVAVSEGNDFQSNIHVHTSICKHSKDIYRMETLGR